MARVLLIADLHLSAERPATTERFFAFLDREARGADALYILGDLFEYWIGDDELDAPAGDHAARAIVDALARHARQGTALYFMKGNRDFLAGRRLCEAAGAALLEDPAVREIGGVRTLLMHGDTLCTDDREYQAWRVTARSADWRREFLAKPILERRAIAEDLRVQSRALSRAKPAYVMDVNAQAVEDTLRRHGVSRLIHGHTHRAARHAPTVDGRPCERWVLPDWYGSGGYLSAEDATLRLVQY